MCLASSDVIQFAIDHGYYTGSVDDTSFSFSDTYDAVTVIGARFCDARVWYIFANLGKGTGGRGVIQVLASPVYLSRLTNTRFTLN